MNGLLPADLDCQTHVSESVTVCCAGHSRTFALLSLDEAGRAVQNQYMQQLSADPIVPPGDQSTLTELT